MVAVGQSFENWKEFLSRGVEVARTAGVNDQDIAAVAKRFGDYLAKNVNPANREQKLLADLWAKGTEEEQQALANMIRKMVSDGVQ